MNHSSSISQTSKPTLFKLIVSKFTTIGKLFGITLISFDNEEYKYLSLSNIFHVITFISSLAHNLFQ
jgi:hypothetical protein